MRRTIGLFVYILVSCQDLDAFVIKSGGGKIFRRPHQELSLYISAKQKITGYSVQLYLKEQVSFGNSAENL